LLSPHTHTHTHTCTRIACAFTRTNVNEKLVVFFLFRGKRIKIDLSAFFWGGDLLLLNLLPLSSSFFFFPLYASAQQPTIKKINRIIKLYVCASIFEHLPPLLVGIARVFLLPSYARPPATMSLRYGSSAAGIRALASSRSAGSQLPDSR